MVAVYIVILMFMRLVYTVFDKKTATMLPYNAVAYFKYTAYCEAAAALSAAGMLAVMLLCGNTVVLPVETFAYGAVSGAALGFTVVLCKYVFSLTTMAISSIFSTAGLLIPAIAGIFMFDEPMLWYHWMAVAIFLAGVYLLGGNAKNERKKFAPITLVLLLLLLGLNGVTMLMQTVSGRLTEGTDISFMQEFCRTSYFSFATFAAATAVLAVAWGAFEFASRRAGKHMLPASSMSVPPPAENENSGADTIEAPEPAAKNNAAEKARFAFIAPDKKDRKLNRRLYVYGLALALAVFVYNQLATLSTPLLAPVILFTFLGGGTMIISALVGAIAYKERITVKSAIGLLLSIGALILLKV